MYFDLRYTILKTTVNTSSCILATNYPGLYPKYLWTLTHAILIWSYILSETRFSTKLL